MRESAKRLSGNGLNHNDSTTGLGWRSHCLEPLGHKIWRTSCYDGEANRRTKARAVSATSRHPESITSE